MLRDDYIMRMVRRAMAILVKVLGLTKAGQYAEAALIIDLAVEELIGLNALLIKTIDDKSVMRLLTVREKLDTGRLYVLADLIKAEGDVLAAESRTDESLNRYARALHFYLEVATAEEPPADPELMAKINELVKRLTDYPLRPEVISQIQHHLEERNTHG